MYDTIGTLGNSLIQHGPLNDRIYLMKLSPEDFPDIITRLDELAIQNKYTKIFAKIPAFARDSFLSGGYIVEASIPKFYNGIYPAYFLGKYFSEARRQARNRERVNHVLDIAQSKSVKKARISLPDKHYKCRKCQASDISVMTELYKKVFATYPFPVFDPGYISETMHYNVTYFGVWNNRRLVALSSAETDRQADNVEMTDFATLPDHRKKGLSSFLLQTMENYLENLGIKTAYTIARSLSYGMNITFAGMGYTYSGTLINNTNIAGNLEDMNIWYKYLGELDTSYV